MGRARIYTNESVSVAIAEGLKRRGVEAYSARDAGNLGLTDEKQLIYACKEKLSSFTYDTDFLQIAARWLDENSSGHHILPSKALLDRRMHSKIKGSDIPAFL
jgi:hypothetical protein